ncbi:Ribonuclease H-like domain containing protein [Trema orientale]|uniref:Ribonuclease H-like domain containing protein n=1 Tax=Trema orientale TaxID=63057 RepID=A0A2P5FPW5_TREOI|nr:Ribonuclease H-like domain containing protein [Trema orientale]
MNLWLESDSVHIVALLRTYSLKVPAKWFSAWCRVLKLISQMTFVPTHIYQEGNRVADALASRVPSILCSTWWCRILFSVLFMMTVSQNLVIGFVSGFFLSDVWFYILL